MLSILSASFLISFIISLSFHETLESILFKISKCDFNLGEIISLTISLTAYLICSLLGTSETSWMFCWVLFRTILIIFQYCEHNFLLRNFPFKWSFHYQYVICRCLPKLCY
jgi:hypothetical protein